MTKFARELQVLLLSTWGPTGFPLADAPPSGQRLARNRLTVSQSADSQLISAFAAVFSLCGNVDFLGEWNDSGSQVDLKCSNYCTTGEEKKKTWIC